MHRTGGSDPAEMSFSLSSSQTKRISMLNFIIVSAAVVTAVAVVVYVIVGAYHHEKIQGAFDNCYHSVSGKSSENHRQIVNFHQHIKTIPWMKDVEILWDNEVHNEFAYIRYASLPPPTKTLEKIAFGSCIDQNVEDHSFWNIITEASPDIFLLIGDTVYAECTTLECHELNHAYHTLARNHSYFLTSVLHVPILASLDDNDYGINNANLNNPYKDQARHTFLNFFQVPKEDPRWTQADGVYTSQIYGDFTRGTAVQIIILDARYSLGDFPLIDITDPFAGFKPYDYTKDKDPPSILGETQWIWLEKQLVDTLANLRFIVSSIQVLAEGHPFESWQIFSRERIRLLSLIGRPDVLGTTVILTGDRHVGGIYRVKDPLSYYNASQYGFSDLFVNGNSSAIIDITSSSLTHTIPLGVYCRVPGGRTPAACDEIDRTRITPFVRQNNFGLIEIDYLTRVASISLRPTYHVRTYPFTTGSKPKFESGSGPLSSIQVAF